MEDEEVQGGRWWVRARRGRREERERGVGWGRVSDFFYFLRWDPHLQKLY